MKTLEIKEGPKKFPQSLRVKFVSPEAHDNNYVEGSMQFKDVVYHQVAPVPGQMSSGDRTQGDVQTNYCGYALRDRCYRIDLKKHRIRSEELTFIGFGARGTNLFTLRGRIWRRLMTKEVRGWDHRPTDRLWKYTAMATRGSGSMVWSTHSGHIKTWIVVPVLNPDKIETFPFVGMDDFFGGQEKYEAQVAQRLGWVEETERLRASYLAKNPV